MSRYIETAHRVFTPEIVHIPSSHHVGVALDEHVKLPIKQLKIPVKTKVAVLSLV